MSAWRARLALAGAILACLPWSPATAKLPDWAEQIAADAPDLPDGFVENGTRVLLSEMRYAIQPDGTLRERRRVAVQALEALSYWQFGHHGTGTRGKVTSARAWHMPPGRRARRDYSPAVDVSVGDSFLTDRRVRVVQVEGVRRGSLVFFEFEAQDSPYFLSLIHMFADEGPISLARFEVDAPQGWNLQARWLRGGGGEPVSRGTTRVWELRDLPALEDEPLAPPALDLAPMLAVQAFPGEGIVATPATFGSWVDVSLWYDELVKGQDAVTPGIESLSRSLLGDTEADFLERIRSAAVHVRDSVRYVAIELGIGGWRPHEAAQTLDRLYGDCKDKGTLFRSLLAAAGIPSYPVLVNLTTSGTVSAEIPVLGFNHFVVAVPLPPELEVPPPFQGAVAEGEELGRLLIVDTTDERTAIGSLSSGLAGKLAMVVAGARGRIIRLPSDAEAHRIERRIRVDLRGNGAQMIARASRYVGAPAAEARADLAGSAQDREIAVRHRVDRIWTGAEVGSYAVEPETDDGSFMETATLQLGPPPGVRDTWELALFPGAADDIARVPLVRRILPVDYEYPFTVHYEVTLVHVPSAAGIPAPFVQRGEGWGVVSSVRRSGDSVVAALDVTVGRARFPKEDFPELRRFWSAMSSATGQMVSVPVGGASAP